MRAARIASQGLFFYYDIDTASAAEVNTFLVIFWVRTARRAASYFIQEP
jgi:hypothetical protein